MIWGYHVGHHHNVEDDDEANKEIPVTNLNISLIFFCQEDNPWHDDESDPVAEK